MGILILPIINISERMLDDLKKELGNAFLSRVEIGNHIKELPDETYDKHREQYDAGSIISYLKKQLYPKHEKTLMIANFDLFGGEFDYVFGIAQRGGPLCMVSLYRLDPRFYSRESSYEKLSERVIKEAIHELAHSYGLNHCEDTTCVMAASKDVLAVDRKSKYFCESCRERLRKSFLI